MQQKICEIVFKKNHHVNTTTRATTTKKPSTATNQWKKDKNANTKLKSRNMFEMLFSLSTCVIDAMLFVDFFLSSHSVASFVRCHSYGPNISNHKKTFFFSKFHLCYGIWRKKCFPLSLHDPILVSSFLPSLSLSVSLSRCFCESVFSICTTFCCSISIYVLTVCVGLVLWWTFGLRFKMSTAVNYANMHSFRFLTNWCIARTLKKLSKKMNEVAVERQRREFHRIQYR